MQMSGFESHAQTEKEMMSINTQMVRVGHTSLARILFNIFRSDA